MVVYAVHRNRNVHRIEPGQLHELGALGLAQAHDTGRRAQGGDEEPDKTFPTWALLAGECWETAQSVIVRIELPGMRKEDIDVSVDHGRLHIRGIKRSSDEDEPRFYLLMERAFGSFERSVPLPPNVDAGHPEVAYEEGVITVILPKTEATPPTQLSIR